MQLQLYLLIFTSSCLPHHLHPMDSAFQPSSVVAFSSQVVSVFQTIYLSVILDLCQSWCMWTELLNQGLQNLKKCFTAVPQGWWPWQCFLYFLISVYFSVLTLYTSSQPGVVSLGLPDAFYFFHASLFPLMFLHCVRTWIFNGLLMLGCM